MTQKRSPLSGRLSPLRYPGGKGKLAKFVSEVVRVNDLQDGLYVEPYAGGAAVAVELLLTGLVRRIHINDLSRPLFAFWKSLLDDTENLCRLANDARLDMSTWQKMKWVLSHPNEANDLDLGFAMFYLNRTNRSGILNGGPIGGVNQIGAWLMDARFNRSELIQRMQRIASMRRRIQVTNLDAAEMIKDYSLGWNKRTLLYLDPPYYNKGKDLYYNFYKDKDHANISSVIRNCSGVSWIVSYDDVMPIASLYSGQSWLQYEIGYSARDRSSGREAMFFSPGLSVPAVKGSMVEIDRWVSQGAGDTYRAPRSTVPAISAASL